MSPALALLPPIPEQDRHAEQLVLRPRREFVEVELAAPAAAWRACGLRPPDVMPRVVPAARRVSKKVQEKLQQLGGRTIEEWRVELPRRARRPLDPEPGEIPFRFPWVRRSRNKTFRTTRLSDAEVQELHLIVVPPRPRHRPECWNTIRPCPFVSCERHLKYDITNAGNLKDNFPGVELRDMEETCASDVSEQGPQTLVRIARVMNLSDQRALQMTNEALEELTFKLRAMGIDDPVEDLLRNLAQEN